jgi:hypothetical protein
MIKRSLLLSLGFLAYTSMSAGILTAEQALQRVSHGGPMKAKGIVEKSKLVHTAMMNQEPYAYLFQNTGGGYMVLSASDLAYPLLGYSDSGIVDVTDMPEQLVWWLEEYGRQISYAEKQSFKAPQDDSLPIYIDPAWAPIAPLVSTKWNQGDPFNQDCPLRNGRLTYTGCVATSMAQVMNYFKYPEVGTGSKTYSVPGVGTLSIDFAEKKFDWDSMLDVYQTGAYTAEEASAVAYLMKACGYSVEMYYYQDMSGAVSANIIPALINNFGYDGNARYVIRSEYSSTDWVKMIYDNLKNVGPIIYDGNDPNSGGHSFILDGYDGEGYFHFNWGWGGVSDGYFSINALNPEALGTGGGTGGGFNFSQDMCIGIQKPTGEPVVAEQYTLTLRGSIFVEEQNNNIMTVGLRGEETLAWVNNSPVDLSLKVGVAIKDENGDVIRYVEGTLAGVTTFSIDAGSYYPYTNAYGRKTQLKVGLPKDLEDGKYTATVVTRNSRSKDDPWVTVAVPYGYADSFEFVKSGETFTTTNYGYPQLEGAGVEFISDLYYDRSVSLSTEIKNDTDYEVTQAIGVVLLDGGTTIFKSGSILMTVAPNSTHVEDWNTTMSRVSGSGALREDADFTVGLFNYTTGELVGEFGTVTMKPNPGAATVQLKKIALTDCERVREEINGSMQYIYLVPDIQDFAADITLKVTKGYFDSTFKLGINKMNPDNPNAQIPVMDDVFSEKYYMSAGEEKEISASISFPEGEKDAIYYLEVSYYTNNSIRSLGSLRFRAKDSSVNIVEDSITETPEYYNLQGRRIEAPAAGELVIEKRGTKTRKIIFQ